MWTLLQEGAELERRADPRPMAAQHDFLLSQAYRCPLSFIHRCQVYKSHLDRSGSCGVYRTV